MRAIISYTMNMIPYMLITVPVFLVVRLCRIKKKQDKVNWYHEILLLLFVAFVVGLASQTVIPKFEFGVNGFGIVKSGIHQTNLIPFKVFPETYTEVFVHKNINYFIINFLGNIIVFMPFGFAIPALWKVSNTKVIAIGFLTSLFIEVCQLFLTRGTDVDDLILNTIGTLAGLLLYKLSTKILGGFIRKFQ